eukprot:1156018-Pelagomonas_calceolata.AAC.2
MGVIAQCRILTAHCDSMLSTWWQSGVTAQCRFLTAHPVHSPEPNWCCAPGVIEDLCFSKPNFLKFNWLVT